MVSVSSCWSAACGASSFCFLELTPFPLCWAAARLVDMLPRPAAAVPVCVWYSVERAQFRERSCCLTQMAGTQDICTEPRHQQNPVGHFLPVPYPV